MQKMGETILPPAACAVALAVGCALGASPVAQASPTPRATAQQSNTAAAPTVAGGRRMSTQELQAQIERESRIIQQQVEINQRLQRELDELKAQVQSGQSRVAESAAQAAEAAKQAAASAAVAHNGANVAQAPAPKSTSSGPGFSVGHGMSVSLSGFLHVSAFAQNRNFVPGNGLEARWPLPSPQKWFGGADVRDSRLEVKIHGPELGGGWSVDGNLGMDGYGGNATTSFLARNEQLFRWRQVYIDFNHPDSGTTFRLGQQNTLSFDGSTFPVSPTHFTFPLGYDTAVFGWRYVGAVWMQDLNKLSGASDKGPQYSLDLGIYEGNWSGPGPVASFLTGGNVGFRPQLEAKLKMQYHDFTTYVFGHYSEINLHGVGNADPTPLQSNLKSWVYEVGARWTPGNWLFQAAGHKGNADGQLVASMNQLGNIKDVGAFAQVGYHFDKHWSAYLYHGFAVNDSNEVAQWLGKGSFGFLRVGDSASSIVYQTGPVQLGAEYMRAKLRSTTNGQDRHDTVGQQLSLSATYFF